MNIVIKKLSHNSEEVENTKKFLFKQIKKEYGYDYIPQYHKDIVNIEEYYIKPKRNNFFIASENTTKEIIGTIAIREYDKNFNEFKNIYNKKTTASIWRLFVNKKYRKNGLGKKLVKYVEDFSNQKKYNEIYLHTHKNLNGALNFWKKMGYSITIDTNNKLQTVHMIKNINSLKSIAPSPTIAIKS